MGQPGQPTKYKVQYCEELIEHMARGYSYTSFAGKIRVDEKTLFNWEKENEAWATAKEIAFSACQYYWEQQGIDGLYAKSSEEVDGISGKVTRTQTSAVSAPVWIFNMKVRFGWNDGNNRPNSQENVIQLKYNITPQPPHHDGLTVIEYAETKAS